MSNQNREVLLERPPITREEIAVAKDTARIMLAAATHGPVKVEPGRADAEQIFLIYAGAGGDVLKTAKACGVTPQHVCELADSGGWLMRIQELLDLKKLDKFDDVGRAISRVTNFVQANRWRLVLERMIRKFEEIPDADLLDAFKTFKVTKDGDAVMTSFSVRVLADISSALEKCHWLTYQSLSDTASDRTARKAKEKELEEPGGEADMHARIARTMAGVGMKTVDEHAVAAQDAVLPLVKQLPAKNP